MDYDDAAKALVHFKVIQQTDGRFHWELVNPHGTPLTARQWVARWGPSTPRTKHSLTPSTRGS
jgi:hypothetical protein